MATQTPAKELELQQRLINDFGQRPSPKAGVTINDHKFTSKSQEAYLNRLKARFVYFAARDLNFLGSTIQPLYEMYIYRGRLCLLKPVPYKTLDNSHDARLTPGTDELPLAEKTMTPFAQCIYLHSNWGEEGLRVLEDFKDVNENLVKTLEGVITPEVPPTLLRLANHLQLNGERNLIDAGFTGDNLNIGVGILAEMIRSAQTGMQFMAANLRDAEAEFFSRQRAGGRGKPFLDSMDHLRYFLLERNTPRENVQSFVGDGEAAGNHVVTELVTAINALRGAPANSNEGGVSQEQFTALADQFARLQEQNAKLLERLEPARPPIESVDEVVDKIEIGEHETWTPDDEYAEQDREAAAVEPTPEPERKTVVEQTGKNKRRN